MDVAIIVDAPPQQDSLAPDPHAIAFARQIEVKARSLDGADPCTILGVKPDATSAQLDAAYDTLSRWFAATRLEEFGLQHLTPPLLRIRECLREAHAELSREAQRRAQAPTVVERPRRRRNVRSAA